MRKVAILMGLSVLAVAACGPNETALPDGTVYEPTPPGSFSCLPNLDARLDAAEVPAVMGVPVSYFVNPVGETRAVDVVGDVSGSGMRRWDWSAGASDDRVVDRVAEPLQGRWYETSFPTGAFVLPLDADGAFEAIYSKDETALWLHGLASSEPDPASGQTLMPYEDPIALLRFPIEPGAQWTSQGRVASGTFNGFAYAGTDTYRMEADAVGRLDLPELTFTQVHRLRAEVTVTPDIGSPVVTRQTQFLFECFGEVARAVSTTGETNDDFTTAAEIRRYKL